MAVTALVRVSLSLVATAAAIVRKRGGAGVRGVLLGGSEVACRVGVGLGVGRGEEASGVAEGGSGLPSLGGVCGEGGRK